MLCAHKHNEACVHVLILTLDAGTEDQACVRGLTSYLQF